MKKVRKSLIVLPAIATLALTTVASVAGTAAWFLTATTATITASTFTAESTSSALQVIAHENKMAGTKEVTRQDDSNTAVTVDGFMGDASYDGNELWIARASDTAVTGFASVGAIPTGTVDESHPITGSKWYKGVDKDTAHIWHAVSWSATFKAGSYTTDTNLAVLFDPATSNFSAHTKVDAGLRIGMFTTDQTIIYANDSVVKHVDGKKNPKNPFEAEKTATDYTSDWTDAEFINSTNDTTPRMSDYATGIPESKYYLGTLTNDKPELVVTFVAWYEGTDSAVNVEDLVNNKSGAISALLSFYSRSYTK